MDKFTEIIALGIPVLPSFVILDKAFDFIKTDSILSKINKSEPSTIHLASQNIHKLISETPMPHELSYEIARAYQKLSLRPIPVAIYGARSFLNIVGDAVVIDCIKKCWACQFDPDKILDLKYKPIGVQAMPRDTKSIKFTPSQLAKIANYTRILEKYYYFPQEAEFTVYKGQVCFVKTRPKTEPMPKVVKIKKYIKTNPPDLIGIPFSKGIKSGPVRILDSPKYINRFRSGEVLVVEEINNTYLPAIKKAQAVISRKANLAVSLKIPCVIYADKCFKDGQVVTVNGSTGEIYYGRH